MKQKKIFSRVLYSLWVILLCMMISPALTGCNDDKDSDESLLIGTWRDTEDPSYQLVFEKNGQGHDEVKYNGSFRLDENFTWSYDGSYITIIWEESEITRNKVEKLTFTELIFHTYFDDDPEDSEYSYYTRVR